MAAASGSGAWAAGRKPIAWIAIFWIVVLMVLFSWPTSGNISFPFMVGDRDLPARVLLRLGAQPLQGTAVQGGEAELTEIEREFEQAAGEVGDSTA